MPPLMSWRYSVSDDRRASVIWGPSVPGASVAPRIGPKRNPMPPMNDQRDHEDRREVGELVGVVDDVLAEREQHPAKGGDPRGHGERERLGLRHADAQCGGRPLVGPHRQHAATGSAAAEVGDHQRDQREGAHRHDGVTPRVRDGVEVPAEQVGLADDRAREPTDEVTVAEDHQLERGPEPQRHDGQVDAA